MSKRAWRVASLTTAMVAGGAALAAHGLVTAQDTIAALGEFERANNSAPSQATGCQALRKGTTRTNFDSNLNIFGANLNIAPYSNCSRKDNLHGSQLQMSCFDGYISPQTVVYAPPGGEADIFLECYSHGGGAASFFVTAILD